MASAEDRQLVPTARTRWQWDLLTGVSKHSHVLRERSGWSPMQLALVICNKTPSWQHTTNTFLLNESPTLSLERTVQPDTGALNTVQRPCRGWEVHGKTLQKCRWNNLLISPKSLSLQPRHGFCIGGLTTPQLLDGFIRSRSSLLRWTACISWTWDLHPTAPSHPKGWEHLSCWTASKASPKRSSVKWQAWWTAAGDLPRTPIELSGLHPGNRKQEPVRGLALLFYRLLCISNQSLTSSNLSWTSEYTITGGSQNPKYPNSQVWVKTNLNAFPPPPNYITITN